MFEQPFVLRVGSWVPITSDLKGQLISKCLIGVYNSSKQFDLRYPSSQVDFFVRLLEELRITKSPSEIN